MDFDGFLNPMLIRRELNSYARRQMLVSQITELIDSSYCHPMGPNPFCFFPHKDWKTMAYYPDHHPQFFCVLASTYLDFHPF